MSNVVKIAERRKEKEGKTIGLGNNRWLLVSFKAAGSIYFW